MPGSEMNDPFFRGWMIGKFSGSLGKLYPIVRMYRVSNVEFQMIYCNASRNSRNLIVGRPVGMNGCNDGAAGIPRPLVKQDCSLPKG